LRKTSFFAPQLEQFAQPFMAFGVNALWQFGKPRRLGFRSNSVWRILPKWEKVFCGGQIMNSHKRPPREPEPNPQESLEQARLDAQKWAKVAAKPGLSPAAAEWARQQMKSAQASVLLWQKAIAYQEQISKRNPELDRLLGLDSLPETEQQPSDAQNLGSSSKTPLPTLPSASNPDCMLPRSKMAWRKGQPQAALNRILPRCGEIFAGLWLSVIGIAVLLAFPLTGIASSFFVGAFAAWLIGGGVPGTVALFLVAFLFGLFLSVYVWQPHVKSTVYRVTQAILEDRPN
jgi:hypothetical protein